MTTAVEDQVQNPEFDFADRIRKVRRHVAKLTQAEMAAEPNVTPKRYEAWESGRNKPEDIVAIAKRMAFRWPTQVTASWVLGVQENPRPEGPDGGRTSRLSESNRRPFHYKSVDHASNVGLVARLGRAA